MLLLDMFWPKVWKKNGNAESTKRKSQSKESKSTTFLVRVTK